jgi:hypothetical protein
MLWAKYQQIVNNLTARCLNLNQQVHGILVSNSINATNPAVTWYNYIENVHPWLINRSAS